MNTQPVPVAWVLWRDEPGAPLRLRRVKRGTEWSAQAFGPDIAGTLDFHFEGRLYSRDAGQWARTHREATALLVATLTRHRDALRAEADALDARIHALLPRRTPYRG